jgi:hypothetical protein
MVKNLVTLLLLISSAIVHADDIPDPIAWWNQLAESSWQNQPTLIRHLAVRSSNAARAKRWDKTMQEFSGLGFLQYVPHEDVDFVKRLNPKADLAELPAEILFDPELLQLVLWDRGTKISVLANSKRHYKTIASWPVTANDRKNAPSVLAWLSQNLGYDGMILAGLLKNTSELGQGLLVKQSARRWLIKESNTRGEALLQMMKTSGSLAVFEVLLAKGETLAVEKGSKILLGQNNNWMKLMQPEPRMPKPKATPMAPAPVKHP